MSTFAVTVERIRAIEPIEGADRIELAVIGEFRSIVAKGSFKPRDLAVYLPESAILPQWLIEKLNLVGKLSGGAKNRIKAVKLRGTLSQGIVLPLDEITVDISLESGAMYLRKLNPNLLTFQPHMGLVVNPNAESPLVVSEGLDVAEYLDIKQFNPMDEAPARFHGDCVFIPGKTVKYDFENWKKYPEIFKEGDEVVITEKLHGTMCCIAYYPGLEHPEFPNNTFVYSKGLGGKGLVFKWNEKNESNVYIQAFRSLTTKFNDGMDMDVIEMLIEEYGHVPIYLFGEVYGKGVQDLTYDGGTPKFRAFDLWLGAPTDGGFVSAAEKYEVFERNNIPHVPVLYQGPFNREKMLELTDGKTTLGGGHIREGVVITSAVEENVHRFGRKILKSVSGDYLTRKDGTEFN